MSTLTEEAVRQALARRRGLHGAASMMVRLDAGDTSWRPSWYGAGWAPQTVSGPAVLELTLYRDTDEIGCRIVDTLSVDDVLRLAGPL